MVDERVHKPKPKYRTQRDALAGPGQIQALVADMTVIASADVTLAALQEKLNKHNQWLPIDGPGELPSALDFYEASVLKLEPLEFIRQTVEQDIALRERLWRTIPMQHHPAKAIFYRASLPPSRVLDFVRSCKPQWWAADAAFGIVLGT